jgi:uncharacterized protein with HEPN domain
MPLDVKVYLHDIRRACEVIESFVIEKSFDDYQNDLLLRSGVERQLGIIGEALNQAAKVQPVLSEKITDFRQIIDFRNLLIHAYTKVSAPMVWGTVQKDLSVLREEVERVLSELES